MLIIILFCLQANSGCLYHSLSYVVACQNEAKACIVTAIRFFNTLYQRSCFCYNFLMDKILFSNAFFLMCCTYWYQISQLHVDFIKWTIFKLFVIVYMFIINILHVFKKNGNCVKHNLCYNLSRKLKQSLINTFLASCWKTSSFMPTFYHFVGTFLILKWDILQNAINNYNYI